MAIHKAPRFAPSKTMYAFDLDSFSIDQHGRASLSGVWVKKKSGVLWISEGSISDVDYQGGFNSLADFMKKFDSRYGGWPEYTWDGEYMNAREKTLADMVAASQRLDPMLEMLPLVPEGLAGWYLLS